MTIGYLELDDGKLYYEVGGREHGETLVLNHAGFLDSRMWDDQWDAFTAHYRVIRYDMRGFGKSDTVTSPRTRRNDLYALLQHLDVSQAHLLGCSLGGEIVLDLALEYPALAQSLIIVNGPPSGFVPRGEPPMYLMEMIGAMQSGDVDHASELALRIWFDGPERRPDQVDQTIRQRASAMNHRPVAENTWAIADLQPLNPLTPPAIERFDEIKVPTLIIKGALDHAETLRAMEILDNGINGVTTVTIEDAAHVPNLEHPTTFNEIVLQFLAP